MNAATYPPRGYFPKGSQIEHDQHGLGTVVCCEDDKVQICFPDGMRKYVLSVALPHLRGDYRPWPIETEMVPDADYKMALREHLRECRRSVEASLNIIDHISSGWRPTFPDHPTLDSVMGIVEDFEKNADRFIFALQPSSLEHSLWD